jgi:hypothetical protein
MTDDDKPDDVIAEARKRFQRAQSFYATSRQLAIADTQFVMGDSDNGWQWPETIRQIRAADKKVVLTVNLTAQHCNQIINQIRQNKPSARVSPVDNFADKKTAEILGGLLRNIQNVSRADDAHDVAAEHAVYGGEGYWRIYTDYESPASFDQEIRIGPCPNPNLVYVDCDAKELDKSDAKWGFIFEDISREQFRREYPDMDPASWDGSLADQGWMQPDTVRIAEYFYCECVKDRALLLEDGKSILRSDLPDEAKYLPPTKAAPGTILLPDGRAVMVVKERETERNEWKWCKLVGGEDKPVDSRRWPGDWLPIITVVGKELNVNGQIVRKGIVRDLKDPARMVNYAYSETVQTIALQNKSPYLAPAEAIEGYEDIWRSANLETRPYLPYNAFDDEGKPIPGPQRQPPPVMPASQVQLLQLSTEQMRAASGQQNANFGIRSEAASGIGIERLKVQGEVATFHFPDNLRRALQYEAKVVIDLIQKIYDTKRVVRILGLDGKEESAVLDPEMQAPYHEVEGGEEIQRIFNPLLGKYDVVINTGPTFQTQRQEAFATLTELAVRDPRVMQVAGDLVMQSADFPMADQLAERFAKTLPPELRDEKPGQAPQPDPQIMAMVQGMDQALQGMTADMEKLAAENAELKQQLDNKQGELAIDDQANAIKDREADAKILDAQAANKQADAELIKADAERMKAQAEVIRAQAEAAEPPEQSAQSGDDIAARVLAALQPMLAQPQPAQQQTPQTLVVNVDAKTGTVSKTIALRAPSGAIYEGVVTESEGN